jgi:photosystem II stability/assembly factor-like uncharacterized protein
VRACAIAAVATVAACSSSSTPTPAPSDGGAPPPTGWTAAVGSLGTFAQTFDGTSWTARSIAQTDLHAVTCVGNLDGWAAGAGGTVSHTIDGGWAWALQDAHTSADLWSVRFGTPTLGVLSGDAGTLAVTQDGGTTWTPVTPLTGSALRGVAVAAAAGVMLAVGDAGVVLRSADRGVAWTAFTVPGAGDLRSVASDSAAHLVLAVDASGGVWSSIDTGLHFIRETTAPLALSAVALADDDSAAIAVGDGGTVLERGPGRIWTSVSSGTTVSLRAAIVEDGGWQYAGGDSGTLIASTDHGTTWTAIALGTGATLYGLDDL